MTSDARQGHRINILLLVAITLLVFISCLNSYLLITDDLSIIARGRTGDITGVLFRNTYGDHHGGNYRPIEVLSHFLDLHLYGWENPYRRLTNLIVHILNVILVYAIAVRLIPTKQIGFVAALLYAVHPLHAQALPPVAWISGRTELFVTMFYLLAVLLFIRALAARSGRLYCLSIISFALALLSKELAVTLPLVLLAYCVLLSSRMPLDAMLQAKYLPAFRRAAIGLGGVAFLAALIATPSFVQRYLSPDGSLEAATVHNLQFLRLAGLVGAAGLACAGLLARQGLLPRAVVALRLVLPYFVVLGLYLITRFWVLGSLGGAYQTQTGNVALRVGADSFARDVLALVGLVIPVGAGYNLTLFNLQIEHPAIFFAVALLAVLFIGWALIRTISASRSAGFTLLWIVIVSLPLHNSLVPSWSFQARFLYLPAVGFCICAAYLYDRLSRSTPRGLKHLATAGLAAAVVASALGIVAYNSALARSGEITRQLLANATDSKSEMTQADELIYLTFPLSVGETRYVAANAYLSEVLRAAGVTNEVPYRMLLYVREPAPGSIEVVPQQDGEFLVNLSGDVTCFWMPKELSQMEVRVTEIYGVSPGSGMLLPLPREGAVETAAGTITVVQTDTIAKQTRLKIAVKDWKGAKQWVVYTGGRFALLPLR